MPLLCLASPKGGVGKTTLAANLAGELARRGGLVVALDLDPQNALRLHFGVSLHDGAGLMPTLRRRDAWQAALRPTSNGIWLLPYGQAGMTEALTDAALLAGGLLAPVLCEIAANPSTILVVDTPPGPSSALRAVLPFAAVLVTVLLADATSIALIPTVEHGRAYGADEAARPGRQHGFVLNQVNPLSRLSRATTEAAGRHLGDRLLGTISRDESVAEAIASQQSVVGFAPSSRAALDLARLAGAIGERLEAAQRQASPPAPPPPLPPLHKAVLPGYAGQSW